MELVNLDRLLLQADGIMSYKLDHPAAIRALADHLRSLADEVERGLVTGLAGLSVRVDGRVCYSSYGVLEPDHVIEQLRQQAISRATPQ